jgi:actin-related protein
MFDIFLACHASLATPNVFSWQKHGQPKPSPIFWLVNSSCVVDLGSNRTHPIPLSADFSLIVV